MDAGVVLLVDIQQLDDSATFGPQTLELTHPRDHLQRGSVFYFLHGAYLVSNRSELR